MTCDVRTGEEPNAGSGGGSETERLRALVMPNGVRAHGTPGREWVCGRLIASPLPSCWCC